MCEVCAIFGAGEHWSDFARIRDERFPFDEILRYRAERKRRLEMINAIIGEQKLRCEDWDGEAVAIFDEAGRFDIAPTLSDIWGKAERLSGKMIDPLDGWFANTDASNEACAI